ncbi:MAG: hypothetical protein WBV82_33175 [Myxococcaceae bacterium]
MTTPDHLRLAGVVRLGLSGRGPKDAFLFDPHRLALPSWALALGEQRSALLITLDRHLDLVPPASPERIPDASAGLRALDEFARWELDVRNYDHILAAMECGLVGDLIVIARARPRGAWEGSTYTDRRGHLHRIVVAPHVDRLSDGYGSRDASPESREAEALLSTDSPVLLDVDLDCFTTPSDADPTEIVPWTRELIRRHLMPAGSERFWDAVLTRTIALTFAREPAHSGGVVPANRLFEDVSEVLFRELLGTDLP